MRRRAQLACASLVLLLTAAGTATATAAGVAGAASDPVEAADYTGASVGTLSVLTGAQSLALPANSAVLFAATGAASGGTLSLSVISVS